MDNKSGSLEIKRRFEATNTSIRIAKKRAGRADENIRLVVVTKGQPVDAIAQVIRAGAVDLGENYVEEAVQKMAQISDPASVTWHMIGHVQSRKARAVSSNFPWIHSVDSLKLAKRLDQYARELGKRLQILLEYNVSGEESKFGWNASDGETWPQLAEDLSIILESSNLDVRGLMTMAPFVSQAELTRPYFRQLRLLRDYFENLFPDCTFSELSMGMSQDFEVAIEEGATILRIGRAIMGERVN
jgi:PLP dependent protein